MEILLSFWRALLEGVFRLLEGWPPLLSLAVISVAAGAGMLWVFGRLSDQEAIRAAKRRLRARIYELRLFPDEPRLMWNAQKELLAGNLRYIGLMLRPALVITAPMILLLIAMDAFYGSSPLSVAEPAVVTVRMAQNYDLSGGAPVLEAPEGIRVESPPVRVLSGRQVSWRVRPLAELSGSLRVVLSGETHEKSVAAGPGPRFLSPRRVRSALEQFLYPAERRLPAGAVEWIEVRYPAAEVSLLGLRLHWIFWFLVISLASAWLLKGRFGVSL